MGAQLGEPGAHSSRIGEIQRRDRLGLGIRAILRLVLPVREIAHEFVEGGEVAGVGRHLQDGVPRSIERLRGLDEAAQGAAGGGWIGPFAPSWALVYLGHVGTSIAGVSASCLGEPLSPGRHLATHIGTLAAFCNLKVSEDPDLLLSKIGMRILKRRKALGLTQKELAGRLGITTTNIARIEHGEQNLTIRTLAKLADVLGTTVVELVGGQPASE